MMKSTSVQPLQGCKDRKPGGEHHAHADCDAESLVLDLAAQAVDRGVEVVSGYQLGHDELPGGFGVDVLDTFMMGH